MLSVRGAIIFLRISRPLRRPRRVPTSGVASPSGRAERGPSYNTNKVRLGRRLAAHSALSEASRFVLLVIFLSFIPHIRSGNMNPPAMREARHNSPR